MREFVSLETYRIGRELLFPLGAPHPADRPLHDPATLRHIIRQNAFSPFYTGIENDKPLFLNTICKSRPVCADRATLHIPSRHFRNPLVNMASPYTVTRCTVTC